MDVATRFRRGKDGLFVKQVQSARTWTAALAFLLLIPAATAPVATVLNDGLSTASLARGLARAGGRTAIAVLIYAVLVAAQAARLAWRRRRLGGRTAIIYGVLTMVGKWANVLGQRQYLRDRKAGRLTRLIDYKSAGGTAASAAPAT
jgi:lysylphosphatidylglycerol synthetase-like protein (DUF2156 family)